MQQALRVVAAHYDNVLIIANRHVAAENHTETIAAAYGNTFALQGHAQQWLDDQAAGEDDDEDDGEAWKGN